MSDLAKRSLTSKMSDLAKKISDVQNVRSCPPKCQISKCQISDIQNVRSGKKISDVQNVRSDTKISDIQNVRSSLSEGSGLGVCLFEGSVLCLPI